MCGYLLEDVNVWVDSMNDGMGNYHTSWFSFLGFYLYSSTSLVIPKLPLLRYGRYGSVKISLSFDEINAPILDERSFLIIPLLFIFILSSEVVATRQILFSDDSFHDSLLMVS